MERRPLNELNAQELDDEHDYAEKMALEARRYVMEVEDERFRRYYARHVLCIIEKE